MLELLMRAPRLEIKSACAVDARAQAYSDQLTQIYEQGLRRMANDLLHGTLSLEDWHSDMRGAIKQMYPYQAIAAVGGDRTRLTDDDWARIEDGVNEQYKYLDNFAADIEKAVIEPGASLGFIESRAALYAKSTQSEFWEQAIDADLPGYPKDGETECLSNCKCQWHIECEGDEVVATWTLGEAEHCEDCKDRADKWSPIRVPRKHRG